LNALFHSRAHQQHQQTGEAVACSGLVIWLIPYNLSFLYIFCITIFLLSAKIIERSEEATKKQQSLEIERKIIGGFNFVLFAFRLRNFSWFSRLKSLIKKISVLHGNFRYEDREKMRDDSFIVYCL
jgi:FMN-dependent NADH-azoreductase